MRPLLTLYSKIFRKSWERFLGEIRISGMNDWECRVAELVSKQARCTARIRVPGSKKDASNATGTFVFQTADVVEGLVLARGRTSMLNRRLEDDALFRWFIAYDRGTANVTDATGAAAIYLQGLIEQYVELGTVEVFCPTCDRRAQRPTLLEASRGVMRIQSEALVACEAGHILHHHNSEFRIIGEIGDLPGAEPELNEGKSL